jgi:hypothetical protein
MDADAGWQTGPIGGAAADGAAAAAAAAPMDTREAGAAAPPPDALRLKKTGMCVARGTALRRRARPPLSWGKLQSRPS